MDKINRSFQDLLTTKNFNMKITDDAERFIYQGKLDIGGGKIVDFAATLTKNDILSIGQIVYNNIAYCTDFRQRPIWLEIINELNLKHGLYYYLGMEESGRIFLRHTGLVAQDIVPFFNMLVSGSEITGEILYQMEQGLQKKLDQ